MALCNPGCKPNSKYIQETDIEIYIETEEGEHRFLVSKLILHLLFDHHYHPQKEFVDSVVSNKYVEAIKVRELDQESVADYLDWYVDHGFVLVGFMSEENYQQANVKDGFVNRLENILANAEGESSEE